MNWRRGPPIGRGSTATVTTAVIYPSGEILAVKSVELSRSNLLLNEQKIHSTINSPHIIQYKGQDITVENGKNMYNLFMELAPLGSLAGSIVKSNQTLSSYARSILKGLDYLHCNGIVHCDIKPANILVTEEGFVKIADLGCARLAADVAGHVSGTPVYMAPEVARGEQQGYPADVWALGCTVIEMATGKAPWSSVSDPVSAMYQIGFSGRVPEIPGLLGDEAKDFVEKCLRLDLGERWSVKELLQHPFVNVADPDLVDSGHGFCTVSPTSVLNCDPCAPKWNELSSMTHDCEEDQNQVFRSATERIRELTNGLSGSDTKDEGCWVTVRSCKGDEEMGSGKACFSDRVELEDPSFEMENFEVSLNNYFGDVDYDVNGTICITNTVSRTGNGAGEFSRINFGQSERDVNGFQIPSINIQSIFGCIVLFIFRIKKCLCIELSLD